jgi:hypothetical protein
MHAVQFQKNHFISQSLPTNAKALIVIDDSVSLPQSMFDEISRRSIVRSVNWRQDVFQLISSTLQDSPSIKNVHLFTHCHDGNIRIGRHLLDSKTVERYSWDLHEWFSIAQAYRSPKRPKIHIHLDSSEAMQPEPSVIDLLTKLTGAEVIVLFANIA